MYWPEPGQQLEFAGITVRNHENIQKPGYLLRKLEVSGENTTHSVDHYHYLHWPDESAVENLDSLEELVDALQLQEAKGGPIAIHCSAGVGRTGTLLALTQIKTIIQHQKRNNCDLGLSVFSIVRRLREQRVKMVGMPSQYSMLYDLACKWAK